jgi:hypothetical protein
VNAYEKSVELGLTGTDEEKAAILRTLTAGPISLQAVRTWLRENGLWRIGPNGQSGTLYTIWNEAAPGDVREGLADFYASVFEGQAQSINTTDPTVAGRVDAVLQIIKDDIPNGETIVAQFYVLDGGLQWADATAEQIAQQREEAANRPPAPTPPPQTLVCWNQNGSDVSLAVRLPNQSAEVYSTSAGNPSAKMLALYNAINAALVAYKA